MSWCSFSLLVLILSLFMPSAGVAGDSTTGIDLIELDDFAEATPLSDKAIKIRYVKVTKAPIRSVIDEEELNNGLRAGLRASGLFKRIFEPWHDKPKAIPVEIIAEERDPVIRGNNEIQFHLRQGLEIPLPGNRPTYNWDGELKMTLKMILARRVFEFTCWTTSDYDAWRGDFSVRTKLGKRLVKDCTDELIEKIKADAVFMREISSTP